MPENFIISGLGSYRVFGVFPPLPARSGTNIVSPQAPGEERSSRNMHPKASNFHRNSVKMGPWTQVGPGVGPEWKKEPKKGPKEHSLLGSVWRVGSVFFLTCPEQAHGRRLGALRVANVPPKGAKREPKSRPERPKAEVADLAIHMVITV